jgi:hypothetical protein
MNTLTLSRPGALQRATWAISQIGRELFARERRLALFGTLLLALLVPMALGWAFDARELRGTNVWIKPMKFALSIAVLAFTTAWFVGHLEARQRTSRAVSRIAWLLVATGSFELGYITLQATLGEGSHYNLGDTLHQVMYALMGIGAIALTATQPMLAWQLHRHAERIERPALYRRAVVLGLVLTFVFGAGAGIPLSALQPPDAGTGATIPLLGWPLAGGDLRPAHFIGIHAEQLLPLAGWWLARRGASMRAFGALALAYSAAFAAAMVWGLAGRL